jgi:hypothetical protein
MHTGMLWFDNSKDTPLLVKIENACKYYLKKYGRKPTLILVHPSKLNLQPGETLEFDGAPVRPYRPVLPGHIWVGIADELEA